MKPLLLRRGDIMREFGLKRCLMEAIERGGVIPSLRMKGYKRRIYRREDVERFVFGEKGAGHDVA
jgi:hypothetical protein